MLNDGFLQAKEELEIIEGNKGNIILAVADTNRRNRKYRINDTAAEIIKYIGTNNTLSEIIVELYEKYGTSKEEIYGQIVEFVRALKSEYDISIELVNNYHIINKVKVHYIDQLLPLGAFMEITDRCNLNCIHCYAGCDSQHTNYMSLDNFKKIADQINTLRIGSLELSGGEITTHPYLFNILEYAISLDFAKIGLITNGTLLKDDLLQLIRAHKERFNIQIDLHGFTDEYLEWFMGAKHLLEPTKKTIQKIAKWAPHFRVATIVTKKNLYQIEEIADWVYESGVRWYGVSLVIPLGRALECDDKDLFLSPEELHIFENIIDNINKKYNNFISMIDENPDSKNCGCLTNCVSIQVNGDIKLCSMDSGNCLSTYIGNVFTESLENIYKQHHNFIEELENTDAPQPDGENCKDCVHLSFCSRCLLRALTMAKKLEKECKWYETLSAELKNYIA